MQFVLTRYVGIDKYVSSIDHLGDKFKYHYYDKLVNVIEEPNTYFMFTGDHGESFSKGTYPHDEIINIL